MIGTNNPATDDLIVEPIEEAVALYDSLLKELQKFMVSHHFLATLPTIAPHQFARNRLGSSLGCRGTHARLRGDRSNFLLPVFFPAVPRNFVRSISQSCADTVT
jgi:hypothetical protein